MKFGRLLRTIIKLKPEQMVWQVVNRLRHPQLIKVDAPGIRGAMGTEAAPRLVSLLSDMTFEFLNVVDNFRGWNNTDHGMLWAYNQNYMDWLNQPGVGQDEGIKWIDKFIADIPDNRIGLDPYPTALRVINWIKFFSRYPEAATKARLDSLYSQVRLLERRLERHILGNHLLEDAYSLYIAGCYFDDDRLFKRASKLLIRELREQVLPDGAHYEQSEMYHCILLDRLLDCINIRDCAELRKTAECMLGHLDSIVWADGSIPMVNDAAEGVAPAPAEIFSYARRLGLTWEPRPMKECGYRKLVNGAFELLADVGGITASYQPGHSHADALNYELRIDGQPIVVDSGISTYDKTPRRQYERSTIAHNTVTPADNSDSSEVWGGFRVGRRCKVSVHEDTGSRLSASISGFNHCRTFELMDGKVSISDRFPGIGISRIHLAPGVEPSRVKITGADKVEILDCEITTHYNRFCSAKVIEIHFLNEMHYEIS